MVDALASVAKDVVGSLLGPSSRLFVPYLIAAVAVAWFAFRVQGGRRGFLSWVLPRRIWSHASTRTDIKLAVINRAMTGLGLFSAVAVNTTVATLVILALGPYVGGTGEASAILVALVFLLTADFATYWIHRLHHEASLLWPFHAVHHSAEVMSPLTVYRKHPVYDALATVVRTGVTGALQGVLLSLFAGGVDMQLLLGVNVFYLGFHALGSNLRHSHVWLSYGRVMEHIFISPAQHQIHHSRAPRHHDRNYGEVLAVWDWMFGTLYVPHEQERLEFGLATADGTPIPQPHATVAQAMLVPFREVADRFAAPDSRILEAAE